MLNMKERIGTRTRSQYRIRYEFNKKVYDLRAKKVEARDSVQLFHTKLTQLNREIPVSERRQGIPIPRMTDEDFPEKHLEVRAYKIKTPRRMRDRDIVEEKLESPQWELLEKEALPNMEKGDDDSAGSTQEIRRHPEFYLSFFEKVPYEKVRETANLDYYTLINQSSEEVESPWEIEMRSTRLVR
ncbi:uncharacterized protein LOC108743938 [Agrilus planipennis]|nr:uncharacterized protein LOC108743938 [Agrilus planipennis]